MQEGRSPGTVLVTPGVRRGRNRSRDASRRKYLFLLIDFLQK